MAGYAMNLDSLGYEPTRPLYLVIELKREAVGIPGVDQLLKYGDWIKEEDVFGDYSMIEGGLFINIHGCIGRKYSF